MNNWQKAARRRQMWFGSCTRSGELKKVQVWCFLSGGNLEFLTAGDSLKAKRIRRNPRVVCSLGSRDGPLVEGTAEIITDPAAVWRGYRAYWKTHWAMMLLLWWPIRRNMQSGRQVLVRVRPEEPNPFAGITDPVL